MCIALRKRTTEIAKEKKLSYVATKVEQGSIKTLYSIVNELTDKTKERVLPTAVNNKKLADDFLQYFKQKIETIREKLSSHYCNTFNVSPNPNVEQLSSFTPTTVEEINEIIANFGIKLSPEDPLPVSVLSSYLDVLVPVWVNIVNLSLKAGSMDLLKSAVILPLIKELNSSTNTDDFKNYRPISNLVFISKLIECVVDIRLQQHLVRNNLQMDQQYGYKKSHSTEMLLLKVVNNLLQSCDKNIPSVVLLLDLSAAFDTVDHSKLLDILCKDIGITSIALEWFRSFLTNRTQKVKIDEAFSEIAELLFGVAQGSILGPRLFNIYIRSVYSRMVYTKIEVEGFAADLQLVRQYMP